MNWAVAISAPPSARRRRAATAEVTPALSSGLKFRTSAIAGVETILGRIPTCQAAHFESTPSLTDPADRGGVLQN